MSQTIADPPKSDTRFCLMCGSSVHLTYSSFDCANCGESLPLKLRNPQLLVARILWGITLGMAGLTIYGIFKFDPVLRWMVVGFSALPLLLALYCQFVMVPRVARMLDQLSSPNALARWVYSPLEWDKWRRISRHLWNTRIRSDRGEAFISRNAVYIDGRFYSWNLSYNFSLDRASVESDAGISWIEIAFSWTSGRNRGHCTVRVPIPAGERLAAREVVAALTGAM